MELTLEFMNSSTRPKMTCREHFDENALIFILSNRSALIDEFGVEQANTIYDIGASMLLQSSHGTKNTLFEKKNATGRLFVSGGMPSLQTIKKEIRATIAGNLYYDIDIVNCGPTILSNICRFKNYKCDSLNEYITNRDSLMAQSAYPDEIKRDVIAIMNGARGEFESFRDHPQATFFRGLMYELEIINTCMPSWFPSIKPVEEKNPHGSRMYQVISVYEDFLIQKLISFLKHIEYIRPDSHLDGDFVPCFDGLLVRKNPDGGNIDDHINIFCEFMKETYDFDVKFVVKPFKYIFAPSDQIPSQINNTYIHEEYYWDDFLNEMRSIIWPDMVTMTLQLIKNINRVMFMFNSGNFYGLKSSPDEYFKLLNDKISIKFRYNTIKKGKFVVVDKSLNTLLSDGFVSEHINSYCGIDFYPGDRIQRKFNPWGGFMTKTVDFVDMEKVQPIIDFLSKVWCSDNEEYLHYLLSWFNRAFSRPFEKTKVGIVLYSKEYQIGKGIFINQFLIPYIYGRTYASSVAGVSKITQTFNNVMNNRLLINVDEMAALGGGKTDYHQTFEVLKKITTDPTIRIELKGVDSFDQSSYTNLIYTTNNLFSFKIEDGDVRYFVLHCNPCYRKNLLFFDNLVDNIFTQDSADHFFTYICNMENVRDPRDIPMTDLKEQMIEAHLPSPVRFLQFFTENTDLIVCENIKASEFYKHYVDWCTDNGESPVSARSFGIEMGKRYKKTSIRGSNYYWINSPL